MSVTEQRRGRRIMMSPGELDAFLAGQRTCRVATVSADGTPHASALWFLWDSGALWLYSLVRSRRWTQLGRDPRVAVVVDSGEEYGELR
ncbi:pyridoxamine 5'-phosphate oxidase family protein, partial [Streptomyces sp. SID685]